MKKVILGILLVLLVVIISSGLYLKTALPNVGNAPMLQVPITPERINHGEYLANHVAVCIDCHSTRDWDHFSGPIKPGTLGKGGQYFGKEEGFPGTFYSKNITPANLKNWTDGEIFRTITTGVDKNGNSLFPVMPYLYYGKMDKEDVYDIIAYLRSLQPIDNKVQSHKIDFPMNFIVNTIPKKSSFVTKPPKSDTLKYGAYLVNMAACMECHTRANKGQIIQKFAFAGGREFLMPNGVLRSANITPENITGIGDWTENAFLEKFKTYNNPDSSFARLPKDEVNTIMPWTMYGGMDSSDLVAIYKYLRTIKPIKNPVVHFELAKK
jgi:cytochrome c2